jgi:hypothetical protein
VRVGEKLDYAIVVVVNVSNSKMFPKVAFLSNCEMNHENLTRLMLFSKSDTMCISFHSLYILNIDNLDVLYLVGGARYEVKLFPCMVFEYAN